MHNSLLCSEMKGDFQRGTDTDYRGPYNDQRFNQNGLKAMMPTCSEYMCVCCK